jgi:hypothetical protein
MFRDLYDIRNGTLSTFINDTKKCTLLKYKINIVQLKHSISKYFDPLRVIYVQRDSGHLQNIRHHKTYEEIR